MKVLIIKAHPSSKGFTHKIAEACAEMIKKQGGDCREIDLYDENFRQDYLCFENPKDLPIDKKRDKIQAMIGESEALIFIFPMWWGNMPAILKNFFDNNFSTGFSHKYENGRLKKLLKGKKAYVFLTCNGPAWLYYLTMTPILSLKYFTFYYCGLKTKKFMIFGRMYKADDKKRKNRLEKVKKSF